MRKLKIAIASSRTAKQWLNKEVDFNELCRQFEIPIRTSETAEEYPKLPKVERDNIKDVGGVVAVELKDGRRKRENVVCCSMLKLDGDRVTRDFLDTFEMLNTYAAVIYSTHSHTPEEPRLRIFLPLTRDVTPEELVAITRYFAAELGIDQFDECSYLPHQLMYNPSCPSNGEYIYKKYDGKWLNPDDILAAHPNWRDITTLPTSSRESKTVAHEIKRQADPLGKSGAVGAFCRAYGIEDAIETFLSDVYAPSAAVGRYDYIPADSSAGVVLYDGKWAYSHHASDPACGMLLNAFDLVRVHKFPDLDEKAAFKEMSEFSVTDEKVGALLLEERRRSATRDFDDGEDWTKRLQRDKHGEIINNLRNITLIIENDPQLQPIVFNQLADGLEIRGEVPWKHPSKFWRDADDAQLISYVDSHYGSFSERNYYLAITKVADDRSYHPIREYLENLPPWDKTPRVDALFVDYLGAEDTPYTRAVTRKSLCAAVKRVYSPGIKFDNAPVLNGKQGIGKSTLIAKLGREWYSDNLSLTDMNDKTAAEKLQGNWILEIGELAGMRKADIDKVKAFISRQDDKYRASFGRRVTSHPRQSIFIGTTNPDKGFLRDVTGNRRFWPVKVTGDGTKRPWDLTDAEVGQIWAEALYYIGLGEKLYLDAELEDLAKSEQRDAMEQDEREGLVRKYLDLQLPENWKDMSVYDRRGYVADPDDPTQPRGAVKRETVSNIEIWCECFGRPKDAIEPKDSYAIAAIMERIEDWEKSSVRETLPIYGRQRVYTRKHGIQKDN